MSDSINIILRSLGFFVFLSFVIFMYYLVFRNIYFYYFQRYNLYAFLSSLALIFLVLLFFILSHIYANILTIVLKRVVNTLIGAFFIFFFVFIILEVLRYFNLTSKIYFYIAIILGFFIVLYSVINAFDIKVNNVEILSDKVDKEYKIAVVSDMHVGSNSVRDMNKAIDLINRQNVDILLIPGDFVDEDFVFKEDLSQLREIKAKVYYSYGNHETYLKTHVENELSSYNITFLRNKSIEFDNNLQIIGVDDNFDKLNSSLSKVKIQKEKYTILMNHQPTGIETANEKNIDLMLSGHTHNGQIFPFNYLVKTRYEYIKGLYNYNGTNLFVSTGTGTWGPKMRLGSNSELVIITLKPTK